MARPRKYANEAEKQAAYRERKRNTNVLRNEDIPAEPVKPVLRYFGGKWTLGAWVLQHLPKHRIYVEPYGGAGSVLMQKPRSFSEVYNDLDLEVVGMFRVLQDRALFAELLHKLKYTPYARSEFELAYEPTGDPIESVRRLMIRSWMGHSTVGAFRKTGYRTNVRYVRRSSPANDWKRLVDYIDIVCERLRGVNIENRPAHDVMLGHDTPETVFYVDPPYVFDTRSEKKVYRYEMTDQQHREMAATLRSLQGMVLISGYACELYDAELFSDWYRVTKKHLADQGGEREEVLWISPAAKAELGRQTPHNLRLFA